MPLLITYRRTAIKIIWNVEVDHHGESENKRVQGHRLGDRKGKLKMAGTAVQWKPYLLCTYVTHKKGWSFGCHLDLGK